jgi:pilus assembly protein CpaB
MRPKHIFSILLLASVGLVLVLFIRAMPETSATATVALPSLPREEVLVAARPLVAGLLLRAQDVTWLARIHPAQEGDISRPSAETRAAKPESDEAARAAVYGAALRDNRAEHQPIRWSTIVKPGDRDFLQTVLRSGTRALAVPVSAAAGGSGLMFPGDHVDVMLTQSFKNDAPLTRRSVSETVVENLRVLAIEASTKPGASSNAITVTLEVLPQQAEKINVAQELGKLSLTLRSLDEAGVAATTPASPEAPTWAGDVSPALQSAVPPAKAIQTPGIKVMRGNNSVDTKAE